MIRRLPALTVITLACLALPAYVSAAPEIPGEAQNGPIALIGGTIHTVTGPPIDGGVLLFDRGKITALGPASAVTVPPSAEKVDCTGKQIYPGLFDAFTNLGLVEINAVRATRDQAESGQINPNVKAHVAVNPDSELIPVTRSNGVLLAVTAPTGGLISGHSSVLQLDGWTYEEMTLRANVGMHVNWPNMVPVLEWWIEKTPQEQTKERDSALKSLRDTFEDARRYRQARRSNGATQPTDARWEAMLPLLEGRLPLIVHADEAQQIQSAVAFAQRQNVKLIISGGHDAAYCAELLKKHEVPVIVSGVYRLPRRRSEDYDSAYTLPERLRGMGIKFCISCGGRFGASNVRNLPYHAATASAFGLPRQNALKAITLWPAEILGVADRVGSLEAGKDASLFIANGDILETPTQVEAAYIQGRAVDLSDRHKRLWRKYREKYRRLNGHAEGP